LLKNASKRYAVAYTFDPDTAVMANQRHRKPDQGLLGGMNGRICHFIDDRRASTPVVAATDWRDEWLDDEIVILMV
jgi:hypothetical protein